MPDDFNPFSRSDWKRSARRAQYGHGGPGWVLSGILLGAAIIAVILDWLGVF